MCGFAGVLRLGERPLPDRRVLRRMISSIEHRGPDDSGEYFDDEIHLAVVRLAIIDVKGGAQPVRGTAGSVCALNGEIYNHHGLRRQLQDEGHKFANNSDTAVLPPLFESLGTNAVQELRGMFALALWDPSDRRLLLARDRFGIKPLYFARTDDFLIFGSEIKAVLASGLVERAIDTESLDDLFSISYPCPPRTMFRNVYEVLPSHIHEFRGREEISRRRYWSPNFLPEGESRRISRDDAGEGLRELLKSSVYEHLQSDVPVASYLSGGIDSSAIVALVKEVTGDAPATFSIGFDQEALDERSFAKTVADHVGSENHLLECTESTAQLLPEMIRAMELPLQFPLALPYYALARKVRSHGFKVVLTGEGADEIFAGYDGYRADRKRRVFRRPPLSWLQPFAYKRLYRWKGMPDGFVDLMVNNHKRATRTAESYFGHYPIWYDLWSILEPDRREIMLDRDARSLSNPPGNFHTLLPENYRNLHPVDAGLALELSTRLPSWILQIGDRSSMANGVEARVPFLDHRIVDFVAPLHHSFKLRGPEEKAVLRDSVADLLPPTIAKRTKRPFYTPIRDWFFSKRSPGYFEHVMSDSALESSGLFSPARIKAMQDVLWDLPPNSVPGLRTEWILGLVLGCQILCDEFVGELR